MLDAFRSITGNGKGKDAQKQTDELQALIAALAKSEAPSAPCSAP